MGYAILEITNGTTTIQLVKAPGMLGFHLDRWTPAIAPLKGGGVWRNSPLGDGRRMVMRRWDNVIETINLTVNGREQDAVSAETQDLRRLLEQARDFWLPRTVVGPVWIKAQSDCETNPRYAYIYDYSTPADDDPYGDSFTGALPWYDGWPLYLERGHWMDNEPGDSDCQATSSTGGRMNSYIYGSSLVLNSGFETPGGGGADVFANWTETAGTGAIASDAAIFHLGIVSARLTAGATLNTTLQQNINVVAGSTYSFTFWYRVTTANDSARYEILNITAGGNVIALTSTPATDSASWTHYAISFTVPAGCNQVGVLLRCSGTNTQVVHYDDIGLALMTAISFGQASTCANDVFIPNKSQRATLTHIYNYDTSIATYSANLINAALPFNLLPNPVAAGDFLYIGISALAINYGPFSNVIFDLAQAAAGNIQGTWEYWSGAAWTAIADFDDTTILTTYELGGTGVCYINFTPVAGWAEMTVNGVYGYWIRLNVTAIAAGAPRPQQQNRYVYTAITPYLDIASASLPAGDIPAIFEARVFASVGDVTSPVGIRNFIAAFRSTERGSSFDPFINLSDRQAVTGLTVAHGTNAVWLANPLAPTGRCINFTSAGAGGPSTQRVDIAYPLTADYYGAFRLMLRGLMVVGGDCTVQTRVDGPSVYYLPDTEFAGSGNTELIDLGLLTLPTFVFDAGEIASAFTVYISLTTAAGCDVDLYDLVFVPVDECSIEAINNVGLLDQGDYLSLDSLFPKTDARGITVDAVTGAVSASWGLISPSALQAPANKASRMYLISLGAFGTDISYSQPHHLYNPQLLRVCRYFSLRGAR
jgi:hypothetical protein